MVRRGRRTRWRGGRGRDSLRSRCGGLGVAHEDLAALWEATVGCGQAHVQADDETPMAAPQARVLIRDGLLLDDRIAPVSQRNARVRAQA